MALETGVIPQELQGVYSQDPFLPLPESNTSMLDLLATPSISTPSYSSGVDIVQSGLDAFSRAPTSMNTLAAPKFFDYQAAQVDRYKSSENFNALGFDPFGQSNNEYKYGARQTWGDIWSNGLNGMFRLAGNTYIEGWKGWANLTDAIASTSWDEAKQDLLGTPEQLLEQDKITKDIMNRYAIYSTPESEEGIFNRKFFGDMLQQSGFAVGAIGQFLTEELITFGLSTQFSVAKLGLRAPSIFGKVISKADIAADLTRLGSPVWKSRSVAEGLVQGARQLIPLGDTAYTLGKYGKAGAGLGQMAAIGVGGLRRALSEVNMATTEARMEAAGTYGELYNKLYDEELQRTGQAPTFALEEKMKASAQAAAQDNFMVNTGILMLSNRLQFDNLFSKFGTSRGFFGTTGQFADDVLKVTGKRVGKETAEQTTKLYTKGKLGTLGLIGQVARDFGGRTAAWQATKSLGKNVFKWEASEGLQELFQEGSNIALQDYYYDLYHGYKGTSMDKSIDKAIDEQANTQGLKTFLMGALTGRLLSPINFTVGKAKEFASTTSEQRATRYKDINEAVKEVNAFYENPNKFLPEHIANIKVQNKIAKNMEEAVANRDQYVFNNNKNSGFAKMISAAIKTDMTGAVLDTLRGYGETFNDEEFQQAFGLDKTADNISSTKDFFNNIANDVETFHKNWKALKDKYGDSVLLDMYKEGTPERRTALMAKRALDDAIEIMATNDYKAHKAAQRAVQLQTEMAATPQIGASVGSAFRNLGVIQNTQKEIDILKAEIEGLAANPKKDSATRELLKSKKEQLKSLEEWLQHHQDLKSMEPGQKRKFNKAAKSFEKYVNAKNKEAGIDTTIKADDVQEIYKNLTEYIDLNNDVKEYVDAYNIMANPIQFVRVHQRLMESIDTTGKKLLEEHLQELNNEFEGKPPVERKDPLAPTEQTEDVPDGLPEGAKVINKKNGIYLIEEEYEGSKFYYILNRRGAPVTELTLDAKQFPLWEAAKAYESLEEVTTYFEALADLNKEEYAEYQFDGQTLKFGDILVDAKGRKYRVITKTKPKLIQGKPKITIQPMQGSAATLTIESLTGYKLESAFEAALQPENPDAFRLKRTNELNRIYAKRNENETQEQANARLRQLIYTTSKDAFQSGVTIKITKNQTLGNTTLVGSEGVDQNRHLQQNPEPYMIEIVYGGETIGFVTYYNRYTYLDNAGKPIALGNITKEQFVQIFDPQKKDVNEEFRKFKESYVSGMKLYSAMTNKLLEGATEVTLNNEQVNSLFNVVPSAGEYDFAEEGDTRVTLDDLDYSTIAGSTYIYDRRTKYLGNGMYEDVPNAPITESLDTEELEKRIEAARFEGGEDKLRNYGRYVAVVELPNGSIKFIELQPSVYSTESFNDLVQRLNTKSKELKENNLEEKTDPKTDKTYFAAVDTSAADDINNEINQTIYVAVPGRRGYRVNIALSPTGNVRVEFATFTKGSKNPKRSIIVLQESDSDGKKPLNIKDSTDFIERINRAIVDHDATYPYKIGNVRLNKNSFKNTFSENASVDEARQMVSGVNPSIVKNEGIFIYPKKQQLSPSSNVVISEMRPAPQQEEPTDEQLAGINVPTDIQAAQAEMIAKRKAEQEEKRKAEQQTKSIQDQLQDLETQKENLINEISGELLKSGMPRIEVNRYKYNTDPRIVAINQEIAKINNSAALKVSEKLTGQDVVHIDTFRKWAQQNLPEFISVEELSNIARQMKVEGVTVGMFYTHMNELNNKLEGKIAVGKDTPFKYHEAFHSVFRMLLTDRQIDKYLNIAKQELRQQGKSIAKLKQELLATKPEFYSKLTEEQLEERVYEEYLADKFDAWKSDVKTPTSAENKGFFRRLLDFVKNFFKRLKASPLDDLFQSIEKGNYRNASLAKNRFTTGPNIAVTQSALKAIQIGYTVIDNEDGERERIPIYLSQQESDVLSSTIAAVYHRRMAEAGLNIHNEDIMDGVLADYANLYDRRINPYYESDEFYDRFDSALGAQKAIEKLDQKYKIFSNPSLLETLKDSIREHTRIMGYQEEVESNDFDDKVDEYGDRVSTDNWKETYSIGGYGSLSKELRQYIATIVEETTDEFGNTRFVSEEGSPTEEALIEAVNANVLYNGILKAVAGSTNQFQMLERLRIFAENNPEARKFWTKFSNDVDLQYDEDGNFIDIGNKNQANLFQAVIKGFNQFSVDYYFINKDISKKETRVSESNRKGAARNQFSIWYNAYLRLFVDQYENVSKDAESLSKFIKTKTAALDKLATLLKKGNTYKESVLATEIDNIVLSLKDELGISLSPLFIKYSYLSTVDTKKLTDNDLRILKAFEGIEVMTESDAREIASSIRSGKNPFGTNIDPDKLAESEEQVATLTAAEEPKVVSEEEFEEQSEDIEDDVDAAIGRLTKIAAGNAVFDEQVSSTSYQNAEGELVYSHQLPTYNLVRAAELQSEEFRQELKKDKFLATNYLLNNPFFNYIADGLKIARIDGIKSSSLTKNEDGSLVEDKRLNVNQNEGITYGSMSDREFLISLFDLYANNKKHVIPGQEGQPTKQFMTSSVLLGVLEASNTGDMLNLPVIRAVEYKSGKIVLTKEAKDILLNEVKREFDRIARVTSEVNSGNYLNGIIEGYHNGEERGLKFIKTGNMLGSLLSTLEDAAKNFEDISQYNDQILNEIEKYWLADGGQVDQMIAVLKDQNIITASKEDKLENNLLTNYIFRGFKSNNKTDKDRNKMLNMVVDAPVHNIGQVLINNFINTLSARQLFIGDAAENYKNDGGIDEVKRNKGLNGSGSSISSIITASNLGINHANTKSHVVTINDPQYKGKYAGKNKEQADAQMWMSVKSFRYTLFGLGKLNQAQADLLDKIERGESVSTKDIFGEIYKDKNGIARTRGGSVSYNAQTNSIKLVYNDGKKYVKTSGILLSKQLTSVKEGNNWVARPGYEELHTIREKLEAYESANETITFAIPKSASKGYKTNIAADPNSISDENFVEHDNNFWRLQLENPSNKLLITDPTQAKQLIIAEQSRDLIVNYQGEEMTLGQVIDNYLSDTEQRVKNNYFAARDEMFDIEGAFKELKKSLKQSQITPKLGKFLNKQVETLKATGADSQLIEFFTPIKNEQTGEYVPKYDLNHPITLDKFTQLFLAYFSKGVMSEKAPGHSLALASNYGMKVAKRVTRLDENGQPLSWEVITRRQYEKDRALLAQIKDAKRYNNNLDREFDGLKVGDIYIDDLRHNVPEFDEQGNITGYFTEYMMPPHFREDMNIYNEDGSISEAALKSFAVRIPSQDKHSFVTSKLVDFLPAFYGSTAVFPHELIEISGADFDIDKVYMQIMDFYRKDGKRIPYGTAKTKDAKFTEYVMYLQSNNKTFKTKLAQLKADAVNEETYGNEEGGVYESFEDLAKDLFSKSLESMMIESALKESGLPSNADDYAKAVEQYGELNNGVLNNRILEAKIKLQNNDGVTKSTEGNVPSAFQVAEVQPLIDIVNNFIEKFPILRDVLVETGSDVDSMMGQYKAFKNNKEGARNIGPAVNSMLVYAIMNSYGKQTRIRETNGKGEDLFVLTIDGHKFDSYEHNKAFQKRTEIGDGGAVTEIEGYTGERIFYHISAIVSAMTDNAKERLAARLGLNINAVGVVSNMVALGVPLETAVMFNLQPSVREFYKRIAVASKKIKTPKEQDLVKAKVGEELLEELSSELVKDSTLPGITTELLENNIKSAGSNPEANVAIFTSFLNFYNQTAYYSAVAQVLKLSKGLGTTNEAIDAIEEKEEMLGLNMDDTTFSESKLPFDLRQVLTGKDASKPHHNITANYIRIKNQIKDLQKSVFMEKTYIFQRFKETILKNLAVNFKETESFNVTLKRDIISYLGIKAYMQYLKVNGKGAKLAGLDNSMIYDAEAVARGDQFMDIIDTVKSIRQQLPKNYFANKFLNIVPVKLYDVNSGQEYFNAKSRGGINTVESNTWAKLGQHEQSRIEDSFLEIYSNPKTRPLAYSLFNYLIVKDGAQFKSGSFIKFIPPAMFKELLDATGAAHQLLKEDSLVGNTEKYKELFGATAPEMFNEFTSLYTTNVNNTFNIKRVFAGRKADAKAEKNKPKGYVPEVIMQSEDETILAIDLFGGVRKPELTLLTDEFGNEFYTEVVEKGKFEQKDLDKLNYNKEVLKANGFKLTNRPDEKGNNRYYVELPYTVKIVTGEKGLNEKVTYYKLRSVAKKVSTAAAFSRTTKILKREELQKNPGTLYVFGDNDARKGLGGQAKEMRGEPNAMGISTKKAPNMDDSAFKSDAEFEENARIITQDIDSIIAVWNTGKYNKLTVPPIGAGLAKLSEKAPKTWEYLNSELKRLEEVVTQSTPVEGVGSFIKNVGDTIAISNTAVYEKFEPTGSRKQWKVGGLTGEMPTNLVLRNRKASNNSKFNLSEAAIAKAEIELDNIIGNFDPLRFSTEARDLQEDWGITFQIVGNKLTFYKKENGKDVKYDTEITEPAELLRVLNETRQEQPVSPKAMKNTFKAADESEGEMPNFTSPIPTDVDPEEAKRNLQKLLAAKRSELQERKKEDDAGCKGE
jgi:hypothetical protein